MTRLSTALVAVALALVCTTAGAATFNFTTTLSGSQVIPPIASPATGSGTFVYDDVANTLAINMSYSGLLGAETAAFIHTGAAGANGPVQFPLTPNPLNATFGVINMTWSSLSPTNVTDLFADSLYVAIHTSVFPGGEIRGQIVQSQNAVPELPASALALMPCLIGLLRRRSR